MTIRTRTIEDARNLRIDLNMRCQSIRRLDHRVRFRWSVKLRDDQQTKNYEQRKLLNVTMASSE